MDSNHLADAAVSHDVRALPTRIDDITPDWLTRALSVKHPGTVVRDVNVESTIWGTASKVFIDVDYERVPEGGPGRRLCLKGGFDDKLQGVQAIGYRLEAKFYEDIAPSLSGLPECWFAGVDESSGQGLVVIDDLRAAGATFGAPSDSPAIDDVASCLETMAGWHATTWDRGGVTANLSWLTVGSNLFRPVAQWFLSPDHWSAYIDSPQCSSFVGPLRDRQKILRAIERLWDEDDNDHLSLSHGDPHVGNTYVTADGRRHFLDWQTVSLAPWSDDVSYFLVGILDVERRRKHELELIRHYHNALTAGVSDAPSFDQAWHAYRKHQLHGLMFALCPPEMQSAEVCTQMGERYGAAALDHETLSLF